jgi:SAM-dependent methyltransferase
LGEIEAAINQHPKIKESVVVVREDAPQDRRLTAYITGDVNNTNVQSQVDKWQAHYVSDWQNIFEHDDYKQSEQENSPARDLTFNITGWDSSYTDSPIPDEEMREWVDYTVKRIMDLQPQQVLEIGCGTGLLLSQIAPYCNSYWGLDFSKATLQHVEQIKQQIDGLENVSLLQRMANDLQGFETKNIDIVIINSVIQYFPSISYLLEVIENAVNVVKAGGFVFIGDVRKFTVNRDVPYFCSTI